MGQSLGGCPPYPGGDRTLVSGACFLVSVPSKAMSHPYSLRGDG